eukprot:gnl/MRDRNA2_/MRDRNA2_104790_c0_seq1.p1 gnl/MRDRNA2_/MRDRNA2_104790_c0~~gnl/MRDRNA2_/MRDRNA2_104790_c0_seq1.p1  ORF type:complete len:649 (+),score=72.24 gnl/MRDRNA2_/MRDRNA2_104790_c0_seq1:126-2072(+)
MIFIIFVLVGALVEPVCGFSPTINHEGKKDTKVRLSHGPKRAQNLRQAKTNLSDPVHNLTKGVNRAGKKDNKVRLSDGPAKHSQNFHQTNSNHKTKTVMQQKFDKFVDNVTNNLIHAVDSMIGNGTKNVIHAKEPHSGLIQTGMNTSNSSLLSSKMKLASNESQLETDFNSVANSSSSLLQMDMEAMTALGGGSGLNSTQLQQKVEDRLMQTNKLLSQLNEQIPPSSFTETQKQANYYSQFKSSSNATSNFDIEGLWATKRPGPPASEEPATKAALKDQNECWPDELAAAAMLTDMYHSMPDFYDPIRSPFDWNQVAGRYKKVSGGCWQLIGYKGTTSQRQYPIMSSWTNGSHCFRMWGGLTTPDDLREEYDTEMYLRNNAQNLSRLTVPTAMTQTHTNNLFGGATKVETCEVEALYVPIKKFGYERYTDWIANNEDMMECKDKPVLWAAHSNGAAVIGLLGYCVEKTNLRPYVNPSNEIPAYFFGGRSYYTYDKPYTHTNTKKYFIADKSGPFNVPVVDPVPWMLTEVLREGAVVHQKGPLAPWYDEEAIRIDTKGGLHRQVSHDDMEDFFKDVDIYPTWGIHDMCTYLEYMTRGTEYGRYRTDKTYLETMVGCSPAAKIMDVVAHSGESWVRMAPFQTGINIINIR